MGFSGRGSGTDSETKTPSGLNPFPNDVLEPMCLWSVLDIITPSATGKLEKDLS